jgi:hypothetical protein
VAGSSVGLPTGAVGVDVAVGPGAGGWVAHDGGIPEWRCIGVGGECVVEAVVDANGPELFVERLHGFAGLENREGKFAVVDQLEGGFDDGLAEVLAADGWVGADAREGENGQVADGSTKRARCGFGVCDNSSVFANQERAWMLAFGSLIVAPSREHVIGSRFDGSARLGPDRNEQLGDGPRVFWADRTVIESFDLHQCCVVRGGSIA